jgi:hypothetical protein
MKNPEQKPDLQAGCVERLVSLPFSPPFRVISEYKCGTDAHIVDSAGNIIIESSTWVCDPHRKHKKAMILICDTLNEKFSSANKEL